MVCLAGGACKKETDKPKESIPEGRVLNGMVDVLKNNKFAGHESATIGGAFESYKFLSDKKWTEKALPGGAVQIDFTGWFDAKALNNQDVRDGIKIKGLEVKFVVENNGSYYVLMITSLVVRSDGSVYRSILSDTAGILKNIYSNREIVL